MIRVFFGVLMLALAGSAGAQQVATPIGDVVRQSGFKGVVLIAKGDRTLWQTPPARCGPPATGGAITLCHPRNPTELDWPWASVTKQMTAILIMQQVDRGRLTLDAPAARWLPELARDAPSPTIRQLLQHQSGLRNPDDSPKGKDGSPDFYTGGPTGLSWCLDGRGPAGGSWRYNNCDYLALGAILEKATGKTIATLFAQGIAKPSGVSKQIKFVAAGDGNASFGTVVTVADMAMFARFGAAGGLIGPPGDLLKIDRALATGKLLSPASRALLWQGDTKLGYMALGQWSFTAPLKGCAKPVQIIERRGGIGRFQVRNIILPDSDTTIIMFTDDGDYDFGEIWQGKGPSYDLLSVAACGAAS